MSEIFHPGELLARVSDAHRYHEFLRIPAMSIGLYVLSPGAEDRQHPHSEDEIYYLIRGKAKMRIGSTDRTVDAGDVIYIGAGMPHMFFDVEKELVLLVVFAPAETL